MMEGKVFLARLQANNDRDNELLVTSRWRVLSFLGNGLPDIPYWLSFHIRNHLHEHYCHQCGEYIYNPHPNRRVRHYHYSYRERFNYLMYERVHVHHKSQLMEWTRHFPRVLRLILTRDEIEYGMIKVRSNRMLAYRLWSIDEWNMFYPLYSVKNDGMVRLSPERSILLTNVLFTPDLIF